MNDYLILMSDNRNLNEDIDSADYNSLTCFLNSEFSNKHGYDFLYLNPNLDGVSTLYNCLSPSNKPRHASWSKIISVIKVMTEFKNYKKIIYIDSDCIFSNTNLNLKEYLVNIKNTNNQNVSHNDKIVFLNNLPWSDTLPCAGFFIVENTPKIKNFLIKWYLNENYEKNNYLHDWEQSPLQKEFFITEIDNIEIINDWMFREKKDQFLRHIGSAENYNRIPFFKNLIKRNYTNDYYMSKILELKKNTITYDTKKFKFDYFS